MREFWVHSGLALLDLDDAGNLLVTDPFLRAYLLRPELAPETDTCATERQLHEHLMAQPKAPVDAQQLDGFADPDAAENFRLFLKFRDRLLAENSLQGAYLKIHHDARAAGRVDIPPLFIDQLTQIILHQILVDCEDAIVLRTAETWFRQQRVSTDEGRVVVADAATLAEKSDPGMGELGRMLAAGGLAAGETSIDVLANDNAEQYFGRDEAFDFAIELGHGRPGSQAMARLIEMWVGYLLGVPVKVRTLAGIDDSRWRWHVGMDAQATTILNHLYEGGTLDADQNQRLLLLARLDFEDLAHQSADVAGKPVYLGLAMDENGMMRIKPQNLLLNLPLATVH